MSASQAVAERAHIPASAVMSAEKFATLHAEYLAFYSLAREQRRDAGIQRQRAREAEAKCDLDNYRKHKAEARKLFRAALYHIFMARLRKEAIYG